MFWKVLKIFQRFYFAELLRRRICELWRNGCYYFWIVPISCRGVRYWLQKPQCIGQSEMLNWFNQNTFLDNCKKLEVFSFFQSVFFISMLGYKLVSIPLQCFFQNLNSEKFERLTYCGSGFGGVCTNLSYQKSKKSKKRKLILDVHKKFEL